MNNFNKFYEKAKIEEEILAKKKKSSWEEAKRGQLNSILGLKGLCHEITIFLIAYKIKSVLSVYALGVFKFFLSLLLRKSNAKFLLASLKTLTNFKSLPVTLFKELVAAFRNPPVAVKLAPEPGCDSKNCSVLPVTFVFRLTFPLSNKR